MRIFNFLSRKIEPFKPSKGKTARIYACGPTVYNFAHIGNLRTYVFEDLARRVLERAGFRVKLVMNITDVEDKIIRDAKKAGKNIFDFVKPYERAFLDDIRLLNVKPAFKYPKATAHIKEMTVLINKLLKKGLAYESGGSIYFDVSKFKRYGCLNRLKPSNLETLKPDFRSRIDADEYAKDNIRDFVLWKKVYPARGGAKAGEPSWPAKFQLGYPVAKLLKGRPGWHIECSAMSMKYLGPTMDIHAGGVDLLFPHHENEIAQSEGATGKKFARFFIEGEHLLVDGEKMSKSFGNVFTLRDIQKRGFAPLALRYLFLTAHYRSRMNFTWKSLEAAKNALAKIQNRVLELKTIKHFNSAIFKLFRGQFEKAVFNDLDTPKALAIFWKNFGRLSLADILWADKILGLGLETLKPMKVPAKIKEMAKEREEARKAKDWRKADRIRAEIAKLGWSLEDTPKGPLVRAR